MSQNTGKVQFVVNISDGSAAGSSEKLVGQILCFRNHETINSHGTLIAVSKDFDYKVIIALPLRVKMILNMVLTSVKR